MVGFRFRIGFRVGLREVKVKFGTWVGLRLVLGLWFGLVLGLGSGLGFSWDQGGV